VSRQWECRHYTSCLVTVETKQIRDEKGLPPPPPRLRLRLTAPQHKDMYIQLTKREGMWYWTQKCTCCWKIRAARKIWRHKGKQPFKRIRKISKRDCSHRLVCPSTWNNSAPTGRIFMKFYHHHQHHHLPPWIRSFDLFRHRRIAIVSCGVHDLFFREVCSWGRVSGVWCCPFFQGDWSSFVCIWLSRLVFQRSLVLFLWLRFLFYPALCIPSHFFYLKFIGPCIILIVE